MWKCQKLRRLKIVVQKQLLLFQLCKYTLGSIFNKSTHSELSFAASPLGTQGSYSPNLTSHFCHGHIPQERQYVGPNTSPNTEDKLKPSGLTEFIFRSCSITYSYHYYFLVFRVHLIYFEEITQRYKTLLYSWLQWLKFQVVTSSDNRTGNSFITILEKIQIHIVLNCAWI